MYISAEYSYVQLPVLTLIENIFNCKLNDSINIIKEMVDVRDEFKECQGFSKEEVEGFIEMLCID